MVTVDMPAWLVALLVILVAAFTNSTVNRSRQ